MFSFYSHASSNDSCDIFSKQFSLTCLSLGVGQGYSQFTLDTDNSSWEEDNESNTVTKIFSRYHFHTSVFSELSYADLGSTTYNNGLLKNVSETIEIQAASVFAGYYLPVDDWVDRTLPVRFYLKAGASKMFSSTSGNAIEYNSATSTAFSGGGGVHWPFYKNWQFNAEVEGHSTGALTFLTSIAYRFSLSAGSGSIFPSIDKIVEVDTKEKIDQVDQVDQVQPDSSGVHMVETEISNTHDVSQIVVINQIDQNQILDRLLTPEQKLSFALESNRKALGDIKQLPFGSITLSEVDKKILDAILPQLNNHIDSLLLIEGHTDNVGDPEYNQFLSRARADHVAAYLKEKGVNEKRLISHGVADSKPIASNSSVSGKAMNRRVTVYAVLPE